MTRLQQQLFELQDLEYKKFHEKLMPTVDSDTVIGIRTPILRGFAKELLKKASEDEVIQKEVEHFLNALPHDYYEENNLHMMFLNQMKDFEQWLEGIEIFLPYINNWATCDFPLPKVASKHPKEMEEKAKEWMKSEYTYTIRYGIGIFMRMFLNENFSTEQLDYVAAIRSEEYYVNMMIAWYFATALAKQYDETLPYLQEIKLDVWTHNKAIQKAVESYRITPEQKQYLKTLKRKKE